MSIRSGGWSWITAAALAIFGFLFVMQVRLWVLLRGAGVEIGMGKVVRIGFIGVFFNTTLLGGLGFLSLDAIRAGYLMAECKRRSAVVGATLLDRVVGLVGLIVIAIVSLQLGWGETVQSDALRAFSMVLYSIFSALGLSVVLLALSVTKGRLWAFLSWCLLGGVCLAISVWLDGRLVMAAGAIALPLLVAMLAPLVIPGRDTNRKIREHFPMGRWICSLIDVLYGYRNRMATLVIAFGLSLCIHLLWVLSIYLVAKGISLEVAPTFRQVCFAGPPANAVTILPLPANGLGVGEAAFGGMLSFCVGPSGSPLGGGPAIYLSFRVLLTILGLAGLPLYLVSSRRRNAAGSDNRAEV